MVLVYVYMCSLRCVSGMGVVCVCGFMGCVYVCGLMVGLVGVMWVYGLFSYIDDVGALLVYVYVYGVVWVY